MRPHTKQGIRGTYLEARRQLDAATVAALSEAIRQRLEEVVEYRRAGAVLSYVASKDNEVDTRPVIAAALGAGRTVLVPIAEPGGGMIWSRIHSLDGLVPSRFGILEPMRSRRRIVRPPADGVVLVPGVAFSENGYRIGYGGGYFDRFLRPYEGIAIGLAYESQIAAGLPVEPHDVPVDLVVTESRVVRPDAGCGD